MCGAHPSRGGYTLVEPAAGPPLISSSSPAARARSVIRPKRISFPEHFCYCFSSNLCVLNATNAD
jgi:hypothetical protein